METKSDYLRMESLSRRIGFHGCYIVPSIGIAGGLVVMWKRGLEPSITSADRFLIQMTFRGEGGFLNWCLFLCHAPSNPADKHEFWDSLSATASRICSPWACIGDLNATLHAAEKLGGRQWRPSEARFLRRFMDDVGAIDLGCIGNCVTWSNRHLDGSALWERLDRAIASPEWCLTFPQTGVVNLPIRVSDHAPILLDLHFSRKRAHYPFRFMAFWVKEQGCADVVASAWREDSLGNHSSKLRRKISSTRRALSWWNRHVVGHCQSKLRRLEEELSSIQSLPPTKANLESEADLQFVINRLTEAISDIWRQKSRETWLRDGDRNSRFFHASTIIRRRRNYIAALKDGTGRWICSRKGLSDLINDYFMDTFASSNPPLPDLGSLISPSVEQHHNLAIVAPPTLEEVRRTVWSMDSYKAPGPDGFPTVFFKEFWPIVGNQLYYFVEEFFRGNQSLELQNDTFIVLIPKGPGVDRIDRFRPISLCNVVYKVIAKILVNRIRPLLDKLVTPFQSAFVPGRWIAENSVLAQEIMHVLKKKRGQGGLMGIKLDMSKAYDRVEWSFLRAVLFAHGFSERVVAILMECVTSVRFQVLLNGSPLKRFSPNRGLRQGDPLSPYLFILCSDVLSRLILKEQQLGRINGISIAPGCQPLSHLMFADDVFLFGRATVDEAAVLTQCLEVYQSWSGQQLNAEKSAVVFSRNQFRGRQAILAELSMVEMTGSERYLGNPLFFTKNKSKDFSFLKEKVIQRIEGWRSKFLSRAGRTTLITSVLNSIPTYTLSTFRIPRTVAEEIDALLRQFWWKGTSDRGRFLATVSWDSICRPKRLGGLGIRKVEDYNAALLAKLAWQVSNGGTSLCATLLRLKYCPQVQFLRTQPRPSDSFVWRGLLSTQDIIHRGIGWLVGDGNSIRIYEDCWLPGVPRVPRRDDSTSVPPILVSELISQGSSGGFPRRWNRGRILELFPNDIADTILSLTRLPDGERDRPIWRAARSGLFSVKNAYWTHCSFSSGQENRLWKTLWHMKLQERLKFILWRVSVSSFAVKMRLPENLKRGDYMCCLCASEAETIIHTFAHCPFARAIWFGSPWGHSFNVLSVTSVEEFINILVLPPDHFGDLENRRLFTNFAGLVIDNIWRLRNEALYQSRLPDPVATLQVILKLFAEQNASDPRQLPVHFDTVDLPTSLTRWTPPQPGWIKINTDASFRAPRAAIGLVARDERGNVLQLLTRTGRAFSAAAAELWGCDVAVEWASREGWSNIIVETDAKAIFCALSSKSPPPNWHTHSLFASIMAKTQLLPALTWSFTPRSCNDIAHNLCCWAFKSNYSGCFSIEEAPSSVVSNL